tara:strand:- start:39 stop:317 length:279 start_codon:yes stop_codon:yes gene_type:complete
MRLIQILFFCFITTATLAQEIPTNEDTGNAEYKNGDQIPGLTKQKLYDRGEAWINKFYVNPNGVMKTRDAEGGEIVGRARFKLSRVEDKGRI